MDSIVIRGQSGAERIELAKRYVNGSLDTDYFSVKFTGERLEASAPVYAFDPIDEGLAKFFDRLAKEIGTERKLNWASFEGEFELECSLDRLGHLELEAKLVSSHFGPGWTAELRFTMDAGQVERAAAELRLFFKNHFDQDHSTALT
jgi:hypothetical protein